MQSRTAALIETRTANQNLDLEGAVYNVNKMLVHSTLAALSLVTCRFSTGLISSPFEQEGEVEGGQVGEN